MLNCVQQFHRKFFNHWKNKLLNLLRKKLGKRKWEGPLVSKIIIDLTKPKLKAMWKFQKHEEINNLWNCKKNIWLHDIPFNVIKSNHLQEILIVIGHYGLVYVCPSYENLWTTLFKLIWLRIWVLWRKVEGKEDVQ